MRWILCAASLLVASAAAAQPAFVDPRFHAVTVIPSLPAIRSITTGADGELYGIAEEGSGNVSLDDNSLFHLDVAAGTTTRIGELAFTNPASSNLYRIVTGPGGSLTSKLYVVDWVNGAPARIDRMDTDLSGHEVVFSNTDGDPVSTLTSTIASTLSPEYLEAGYLGAQGVAGSQVYRFGIVMGLDPFAWADPPGSNDIRGIAFAPGGAWDDDLYVAQSTVLNGFDDAPGELRRLHSDGVGNYASPDTVIVSEASGLLEFAREIAFDTSGMFDGDLLYLQADSQLLRVTPAGGVSLLATGVRNLYFAPDGTPHLVAANALYRVERVPRVPALGPFATPIAFGLLVATGVLSGLRGRTAP